MELNQPTSEKNNSIYTFIKNNSINTFIKNNEDIFESNKDFEDIVKQLSKRYKDTFLENINITDLTKFMFNIVSNKDFSNKDYYKKDFKTKIFNELVLLIKKKFVDLFL